MKKNEQLRVLQDIEYEALKAIKQICEQHQITFFLRGGSVLGAVKYQNFVPWDDDIDIAFPRKDYLRLIDVMPEQFGGKFQFVCYQKTRNAHCYFPRVILGGNFCKQMGLPQNNERGLVLIDILPIDGMPDNFVMRRFHIFKAYMYRVLASLWTLEVKNTVNLHDPGKQKILKCLHFFRIHHLYEQDTIYRMLDKMYAKYSFGGTLYAGMLSSSKLEKEIVPTSWWGEGVEARFRDINVTIPQNFDGYLKKIFGANYNTSEPSEQERKKSHITGINI